MFREVLSTISIGDLSKKKMPMERIFIDYRPAATFPAHHSIYGALPIMSYFVYLLPLFRWMLDYSLAPRLRFVFAQENSRQIAMLPRFWLAWVGILDILSIQTSRQEAGFDLAVYLKFQIARLPS
jgi:hypothetical protein